jgi:thiamine-phosphate pyrophosphorylase
MRPISKLHYITTNASLAEQACKGGVDWIQLRLKNIAYDEFKGIAKEVQAVCKQYGATFIINDNVKLAFDIDADGVHVGKGDPLPWEDIQEILARKMIIGCTTNTIEDFIHLSGKAVSYIGLGPFRYTATKQHLSPILGIEGYKNIFTQLKEKQMSAPPVIGIGGIVVNDVAELLSTGLYGIAVSGAISNADDITGTSKKFKYIIAN